MPVAYPFRALARRPSPEAVVLAVAALLVLAGAAGPVPTLAVVALAGAAGSTLAGVRLSRLAAGVDAAPTATGGRVARRRAVRPRRAAALFQAAVVAAGLTTAVLPLTPTAHRSTAAAVGLGVAAVLLAAGSALLPVSSRPPNWPAGATTTAPARVRLRRLAEAGAPGGCLVLAAWLLLPHAGVAASGRLPVTVALGVLATVALTASTGPHRLGGVARCRGGAALTLFGLVLLAALSTGSAPGRAALLAVPPLVVGLLLTAAGVRRVVRAQVDPPRRPVRVWPRAVVPAAAVVLAGGQQVLTGVAPDRTAVVLALAVVPPLVLRELLRAPRRPPPPATVPAVANPSVANPSVVGPPAAVPAMAPPAVDAPAAPTASCAAALASRPGGPGAAVPLVAALTDGEAGGRAALLRAVRTRGEATHGGALLVVDLHPDGQPAAAGDDLTAEAVRRVRAVVAPDDAVLGLPDEALAVVTSAGPMLAYALGVRLVAVLAEPYLLAGAVVRARVSVGLAELAGIDPVAALRQADLARRRAVQLGRDRVEWYDAYLEEQLVRRLDLERELPGAAARGELDLVYQPVLGLADRQPVGAEALLRWRSPVLGTVLPAELLPVAEDLDLLGELGAWVLDRACRQLAAWSVSGRQVWMAVNVTIRELTSPDFVTRTAAVLDAYGVPLDRLVVEVAEPRVAAELPTVVARLAGLRSLGIRTALDGFRAEHASLAQLRRLPIDLLKVGPELVGATADPQRQLLDVVVSVGDRLGLEVVAGELESERQVAGARRAGCHYGQGFALARPATAERVEAYFEEFPASR
ncbi:EAL domain, c-di-GMP-specific phosphodiesterase class I (or its enzymatically inactive variant) [Micromonospora nigra]|uniref:EAL domain, c-di-GMP-specific phosphodiesterase class I (Or its enzymatically inactive variant) n=1 Tax=Micromonospora nigra TaxID=145857 RepID=A0A1C6SJP0_9ACTN|nr:bifunctional diguanylate cyclase/phosphodiesterase [Micromonospora nigra]SCL29602.1 EAL domain, c-di-GMP-specific phosphodiesterase class I (or its enzymatically inactive variant) [Micromonospora nigra]